MLPFPDELKMVALPLARQLRTEYNAAEPRPAPRTNLQHTIASRENIDHVAKSRHLPSWQQLRTAGLYQVLRTSVPVFTVLIYRVIFSRTYETMTYMTLVPIMLGAALTTIGEYTFTDLGFLLTFAGVILAAVKTVATNRIMTGPLALPAMEVLLRMSPYAAMQSLTCAFAAGEFGGLAEMRAQGNIATWTVIALLGNGMLAFGLNVASFQTNKVAGALTISVCGNLKQCLTVLLGIIAFGVEVHLFNGAGMVLTMFGAAWYSKPREQTSTMSPSQDIVPAGNSFAQQGSMDWVGLSSRSVHFTMDVLSRFMAAGVQPFTIVVGQEVARHLPLAESGQEVARHLPLAESGQRNVQDALDHLASYQSIGSVLWFGFGLRGLARTLGATAEGRSPLALCAALGESFHEDYAASVLHHLLVKACNGIRSRSKFPILVDAFVRLAPRRRRLQEALKSRRSGFFLETERPSPKDMAGALLALGMLRRGQYEFVTAEGGLGSGWLAAMAEWMYDLGVGISDAQGNAIYRSPGPGGDVRPHLLLRLSKQTADVAHVGASPSQDLTLASKTYYLRDKLGIAKLLCVKGTPFSGGRLSRHECLGEAYGLEFAELMGASDLVGCAFGCAARIFSGIMAFEKPGMDIYHAVQTRNYFEESGGRRFIRFSVRRFPELAPLTRRSYEQLALSFQAAQVLYIQSLFGVRKLCACNICSGSGSRPSLDSLCLLAVFKSVVIVCQMLSGMEVADGMGLRRDGLE
ncbi:hypothetical protein BN1723_000589 [Verticillium longisporum]|uniref:Sugar phosphate transporter domain-containing protein n=3 Tax=Verticillium longisporum TaxID=100787 RepID=A0A0G4M5X8_VERLO|nr:hypothetical protein BN1723_000589 [Verticillium longisporum]